MTSRIRFCGVLAVAIAAALLPGTARAQDLQETISGLQSAGEGFVKGCDYVKYFKTFDQLSNDWDQVKQAGGIISWAKGLLKGGTPMTDYLQNILNAGTKKAAEESSKTEKKALIHELEQVCQIAVQADETNRIYQIVQAGHMDIGNAIEWIRDDFAKPTAPQDSLPHITDVQVKLYTGGFVTNDSFPDDKLMGGVTQAMLATLQSTNEQLERINMISKETRQAWDDLDVWATWDATAHKWKCPAQYTQGPDTTRLKNPPIDKRPYCGPASPERTNQILAKVETLNTEVNTQLLDMNARAAETDVAKVMTEYQERRVENYLRKNPFRM